MPPSSTRRAVSRATCGCRRRRRSHAGSSTAGSRAAVAAPARGATTRGGPEAAPLARRGRLNALSLRRRRRDELDLAPHAAGRGDAELRLVHDGAGLQGAGRAGALVLAVVVLGGVVAGPPPG